MGVGAANVIFLPIANRLKAISAEEVELRMMTLEGILSIQAGDNPRLVAEKLMSYLPPAERDAEDERRRLGAGVEPAGRGGLAMARGHGGRRARRRQRTEEDERRALAADLRRHDHAADGAVHGAVLDLLGQHLQVPDAAEGAARRPSRATSCPAARRSPSPARRANSSHAPEHRRRAGDRAAHRHSASDLQSTLARHRSSAAGQRRRPPAAASGRGPAASRAASKQLKHELDAYAAKHGFAQNVHTAIERARPGDPRAHRRPAVRLRAARRSSTQGRPAAGRDRRSSLNVDQVHPIDGRGQHRQRADPRGAFPSNWELSTARASTVVRFLIATRRRPAAADRHRLRRPAPDRQQRDRRRARAQPARGDRPAAHLRSRRNPGRRRSDHRTTMLKNKKILIPLVLLLVLGVGYTMTKPKTVVKEKIKGTIYVMPQGVPAEPQRRPLRQAHGRAGARARAERRAPPPRAARAPAKAPARCPRKPWSAKS